jgi:hypothetical protein
MEKDGFQFDFVTQRFLINRWETEMGKYVYNAIVSGIKNGVDLRAILDGHVLEHSENVEPYGYPIYPKNELGEDQFWVLTSDDLRGICFYNEDFSNSPSLEKKSLSYCSFYNCDLSNSQIGMVDISYGRFEKCNMSNVTLASSGGFNTIFKDCNLSKACLWKSGFIDCNFEGANLTGVYFEDAKLKNISVNHNTKFGTPLQRTWEKRKMPLEQTPDILRAIRISYNKAEIWNNMDHFMYEEKKAHCKYILYPALLQNRTKENLFSFLRSYFSKAMSGYSTKPFRVIMFSFVIALIYAGLYLLLGTPYHSDVTISSALESLYFSFTTFTTLGYGDIAYDSSRPWMRLVCTSEAWGGAICLSLFVTVLARKIFR